MIHVSPEQFKCAFLAAVEKKEAELLSAWQLAGIYTQKIVEMLPIMAEALGLSVYNEYYKIDAIFYEEKDQEHFKANATYAKYIAIALEHENEAKQSETEVNKLQFLNTPLKVLITYPGDKGENHYLSRYAKIIQWADVFGDIATKRKQLVIFGSLDGGRTKWSFHVYSSDGVAGTFAYI
jgi:hypothetical protein